MEGDDAPKNGFLYFDKNPFVVMPYAIGRRIYKENIAKIPMLGNFSLFRFQVLKLGKFQ